MCQTSIVVQDLEGLLVVRNLEAEPGQVKLVVDVVLVDVAKVLVPLKPEEPVDPDIPVFAFVVARLHCRGNFEEKKKASVQSDLGGARTPEELRVVAVRCRVAHWFGASSVKCQLGTGKPTEQKGMVELGK